MPLDPALTEFTTVAPVIQSFDSEDIASGENFIDFWGTTSEDDSGLTYDMISFKANSAEPETTFITPGGGGNETYTFDSAKFNNPRFCKGTGYIAMGVELGGGANYTVTVRFKKWDGSSETNLSGSIVSATLVGGSYYDLFLKVPITTESMIQKGEQVRVSITLASGTAAASITMGHDPNNRDGTIIQPSVVPAKTTVMQIKVPFRST